MNTAKIIESIVNIRNEDVTLLKFMRSVNLRNERIVDIGCGYGHKLSLLKSHGYDHAIGVDINQKLVEVNIQKGLNCMSVSDFNKTTDSYDVLLMSHVIEHFHPRDLLAFMDHYLQRLKPGGYLIITTPLFSSYFYDDFDHVKPYHPLGINMVFAGGNAQVQYYSENKLELIDLWFRKGPIKLVFRRGIYLKKYNKIPVILNVLLAIVFRLSFGLIGKADGWMGLYKKSSG